MRASTRASNSGVDMSISLICARPVMPGRALKTPFRTRASISSCWLNRHGRGPTRLISPFSTFHNCGSSSSLVRRKNRPNGVTALLLTRCVATEAVPGRMVRNFNKMKGF